jgi:hypothetical protein
VELIKKVFIAAISVAVILMDKKTVSNNLFKASFFTGLGFYLGLSPGGASKRISRRGGGGECPRSSSSSAWNANIDHSQSSRSEGTGHAYADERSYDGRASY